MTSSAHVNAYVLAGGQNSRMGTDKALLTLDGKTFISRIIEAIQSHCKSITIISNTNNFNFLGYPVIEDEIKDKGPLAGIYSGLKHSKSSYNLFVSCDIPLLNESLISFLFSKADFKSDACILIHNSNVEPLCGLYNKNIADKIISLIDNNELGVINALKNFNVQYIDYSEIIQSMPFVLTNINTKDQLTEIEEKLNGKH